MCCGPAGGADAARRAAYAFTDAWLGYPLADQDYLAGFVLDPADAEVFWTRIDAGARYATKIEGRPTTFRATVQNVFDREYWSGVASYGAFSQGYPRTLQLSATVDF